MVAGPENVALNAERIFTMRENALNWARPQYMTVRIE